MKNKINVEWATEYFTDQHNKKVTSELPELYVDGILKLITQFHSGIAHYPDACLPIEIAKFYKNTTNTFYQFCSNSKSNKSSLIIVLPLSQKSLDVELINDFLIKYKRKISKYKHLKICISEEKDLNLETIKEIFKINNLILKQNKKPVEFLTIKEIREIKDLSNFDFSVCHLNLYKNLSLIEQTLLALNASPWPKQKIKQVELINKIFISKNNSIEIIKFKENYINLPLKNFDFLNINMNFEVFSKIIYNLLND